MSKEQNFNFIEKSQYLLLKTVGRVLTVLPERVTEGICIFSGNLIYFFGGKRRQTLLRNLHHSYPDVSEKERRLIGRRSCQQTVELGLLGLTAPWVSQEWISKRFTMDRASAKRFEINPDKPRARVTMIPHFTLTEGICFVPAFLEKIHRDIGVIYRPFRNRAVEKIIKTGRERWGLTLLSRKEGFAQASTILRRNGMVGILFDQNAGQQGSLTPFLGRVASSTELPALLAQKHATEVVYLWIKRIGFWRGEMHLDESPVKEMDSLSRTLEAQDWLEQILRDPETDKASWLWLHNRWRTQDEAQYRFQIRGRKVVSLPDPQLVPDNAARFWIRMPNWLGDIVMTLPLLRALAKGRPDVRWTLFTPSGTADLLKRMLSEFDIRPLPPKGWKRFVWFRRLRLEYPDLFLLFTQSTRSDFEARLTRAKDRYGLAFPGKKRRFLTHTFPSPYPRNPQNIHQFQVWSEYLASFGLNETPDLTPFEHSFRTTPHDAGHTPHFGLICGTENSPEKRWSPDCFARLIQLLANTFPEARFSLFGTAKDREITTQVAALSGLSPDRLSNQAGQTSLTEFATSLASTTLLIGNDTGGIHLANALGIPVVVLFGPTNPLRTAPVFNSPRIILQPSDCAPHGGASIQGITPEAALAAVHSLLRSLDQEV